MTKNKTTMKLKNYFQPTPKNLRKLGDSLLAITLFVAGFAYVQDMKGIMISAMAVGIVGKFLTNFFKED